MFLIYNPMRSCIIHILTFCFDFHVSLLYVVHTTNSQPNICISACSVHPYTSCVMQSWLIVNPTYLRLFNSTLCISTNNSI